MAVFREEKEGADGIKKSIERSRARFLMLLDTPPDATKTYSPAGFHTYIIDPSGIVQADVPGTKMKRPGADKIFAALTKAQEASEAPVSAQ